jgi:hypothetical protein
MDNNQEELLLWRQYNDYLEGITAENIGEFLNFVLWQQQQSKDKTSVTSPQATTIELEFSEEFSNCLKLDAVLH